MKYLFNKQPKPVALAVATAVAMSCIGTGATFAQEVEELVIQAERRDTTESTTAISMEVLTGEDLAENQVVGFEDLQNEVPNLQFNTNGFGWAQANIRGVGNVSGGGATEQVGVPIIIDGGAQGEEISLGGALMDVGSIQVLRGPQGTFIGQSAAGGAIIVTTERPNFDGVNGYIEGQIATYSQEKVMGAINLPMTDTVAARLSFLSLAQGSFYSNNLGSATGTGENYTPGASEDRQFRLWIRWSPNEKFNADIKIESSEFQYSGNPSTPNLRPRIGYDNDGIAVTTYSQFAPGPNGETYAPTEPFQLSYPNALHSNQDNQRYTIDLKYKLDSGITLNSVTNWTEFYGVNGINSNHLGHGAFGSAFDFLYGPENYTVNQEFTIISSDDQDFKWLAGVSANKRFTEFEWASDFSEWNSCGWEYDGSWSACDIAPATGNSWFYSFTDTTVEDFGAFFQLDYQITETVELTLGGRYNRTDISQLNSSVYALATAPSADNPVLCPGYEGSRRELYCPANIKNILPDSGRHEYKGEIPVWKIGVNWEPSDDQYFYAFYARGHKAGQPHEVDMNGIALAGEVEVSEETVDDFEFGWKGTLLDGALNAELGYFYQSYKDMQYTAYATTATTSGSAIRNIGGSSIKGFEGSLRTNLGNLNINASFGFTDSELNGIDTYREDAFPNTIPELPSGSTLNIGDSSKGCDINDPTIYDCFDFSPYRVQINGAQQLSSPELSYNLSLDYPIALDSGATLTPKLSYRHTDENYSSIFQETGDNYYTRDEVDTMDLSVTYDVNDWSVQGFINNLTDETYIVNAGTSVIYGDPRVIGLRAKMNF